MNWKKVAAPVLVLALLAGAWQAYGWGGVALAAGAIVMSALLLLNRVMHVLGRAAKRPKAYVGSAVMLNAKLRPGVTLLHVMALTESIGEPLSAPGEQPEVFRWTDGTQSSVTCEFVGGKLAKWSLVRPSEPPPGPAASTGS
jgi:hypothetical protein